MDRRRRKSITVGVLFILIGGWLLSVQFYEPLKDWANAFAEWPMWVVAIGILIFVAGLVSGSPSLTVPAAVISGLGGIFYYQNLTDQWDTWAYAWTLIPGFIGVGTLIQYLLQGKIRLALRQGGGAIVFSLFLFGVFGGLFYDSVGGPAFLDDLSDYWPVLLIIIGLSILLRPMFKRKRQAEVL